MATKLEDLGIFYSGAKGLNYPQNNSLLSIGGKLSSSRISNNKINNVFDSMGYMELKENTDNNRCIFIKNLSTTDSINNLSLWIERQNTFEKIFFGVSLPTNNEVYQLESINETPFNVEFYEAYSEEDKIILIPELKKGEVIALWLNKTTIPTEIKDVILETNYKFDWT